MVGIYMSFFDILHLSFVSFDLWFSIMCLGNLIRLFMYVEGWIWLLGLLWWWCEELFDILGINYLLSNTYLSWNVRACGWLLHGLGQFWLLL